MNYQNYRKLLLALAFVIFLSTISEIKAQSVESQFPSLGCGDGWDTTFSTNGVNGAINAMITDGLGNTYIAGNFTSVQGIPINRIAKWDGTSWSGFGTGVTGQINSIAISGTDIYIGGNFASAGGVFARNVAKWDGTSWSALGSGIGGGTHVVETVAVFGGEVYFGGNFNTSGGSPATGLVRWNGTSFSAVGTGINGQVYSMAVSGGSLYVGGFIRTADDTTVGGLLKWDGAAWSGLGLSASNTTVRTIGINGSDIYAGGTIRTPGGISSHAARLNGSTWTSMGSFVNNPLVLAFAFVGSDVYAGGTFERWNGTGGNGIMKYAGGLQWSTLGSGTELGNNRVNSILVSGNTLLIAGDFQMAGGVGASNIATLTNDTTWAAAFPGTGLDSNANAIAVSGTDVYIGGSFISAGNVTANRIVKWNGLTNTWSTLGTGISGFNTENSRIDAVAVAGGKVYVGGRFSTIGGINANNIAVWNGTIWAPLGTGMNEGVTAIVIKGEDVYVGGGFSTAGGVAANRVAKWNGTSWSSLGASIVPNTVSGMAFMGNDLYVGTGTTTVANPAYFTRFDGTTWTALGADLGDRGVSSVAVSGTDVYVSGGFTSINGTVVNRIAKWNGTTWSALGGGLPASGFQISGARLATSGSELFAIGNFTVATGGPADRIARWNGTAWSPLGTGLNADASSITVAGGDVFVGGSFLTAGCNSSPYFARWRQNVWTGASNTDWHNTANWGGNSVPPANVGISINTADVAITSADVTVNSLIVASGRTITIGAGRTLTVNQDFDLSGSVVGPGTLVVNGDLKLNNSNTSGLASLTVGGNLYLNGGMISGPGMVTLTACRAGSLAGGSSSSSISSPLTRCVNSTGVYRFPVGTAPDYSPVVLSNIGGSGTFTVDPKTGPFSGPATGLTPNRLQRWWQLTNGGITQADITFNYFDNEVVGLEGAYRVFRINGGAAEVVPATFNLTANTAIATGVTSFGAFTMAEAPAANVTVAGRVTRPGGQGIPFIQVTLTDGLGNTRTTVTKHTGSYEFQNVAGPQSYTLSVEPRKRTAFAAPQRVLVVSENLSNVNFVRNTP